MKRKGYTTGLVTMCIGSGMGMAMIVKRQNPCRNSTGKEPRQR